MTFWQPTVHLQQNIFKKTLIEVESSHFYASFGTFCTQIDQLFEVKWVLWLSLEIDSRSLLCNGRKMLPISEFFRIIKDSLCLKRCQKKCKVVEYKLLWVFFQKHFIVLHERFAVKNSISTYVCYTPDGLFWLNLHTTLNKTKWIWINDRKKINILL